MVAGQTLVDQESEVFQGYRSCGQGFNNGGCGFNSWIWILLILFYCGCGRNNLGRGNVGSCDCCCEKKCDCCCEKKDCCCNKGGANSGFLGSCAPYLFILVLLFLCNNNNGIGGGFNNCGFGGGVSPFGNNFGCAANC